MENELFTQNTRVEVRGLNQSIDGRIGFIKGVSSKLPVVGNMYIVDFETPISDVYEYTSVVIPEAYLEIVV